MNTPRIVLYGHDSYGLGHLRRNLALAQSLSQLGCRPDQLIATGTVDACAFGLPPNTDLLALPAVTKDRRGRYRTRNLSANLDVVMSVRGAVLDGALTAFAPDLVIVDKVALGLGGELAAALRNVRAQHGTRIVLGLRDVLDAPVRTRREWDASGTGDALRLLFDEVWVYGDPSVYDVVEECALVEVRDLVRYCGYLATGRPGLPARPAGLGEGVPYVVCTVGGGADGADLAEAFAAAPMPDGMTGVLVAGPHMPQAEYSALARAARLRGDMVVMGSNPNVATWLAGASAVVSMGGYNSVSEILATATPALVVPRSVPRMEQAIRARALAERGLVEVMDGCRASGESIGGWLARAVRHSGVERGRVDRSGVDLDGLRRVRHFADALLTKELDSVVSG